MDRKSLLEILKDRDYQGLTDRANETIDEYVPQPFNEPAKFVSESVLPQSDAELAMMALPLVGEVGKLAKTGYKAVKGGLNIANKILQNSPEPAVENKLVYDRKEPSFADKMAPKWKQKMQQTQAAQGQQRASNQALGNLQTAEAQQDPVMLEKLRGLLGR